MTKYNLVARLDNLDDVIELKLLNQDYEQIKAVEAFIVRGEEDSFYNTVTKKASELFKMKLKNLEEDNYYSDSSHSIIWSVAA